MTTYTVDARFSCPACGENRLDELIWIEGDTIVCQTCQTEYTTFFEEDTPMPMTTTVQFRASAGARELWNQAAASAGLPFSTWAREMLMYAASAEWNTREEVYTINEDDFEDMRQRAKAAGESRRRQNIITIVEAFAPILKDAENMLTIDEEATHATDRNP